ncbi:MAG: SMC-Scp complex subunit ScpB [Candidatus Liptonbacteria bacterium]|nr:SMC-Scp complex subunit ScpB [Candidatus Liptonbacteria bacterium]
MDLPQQICAVLFYQAEPISVKRLAGLLKQNEGAIRDSLGALEEILVALGLRLIHNGDEVTLGTAPEAGTLIEMVTKEELSKDLSRAALETLAVVLYKGPVTRSEIDYIRGVNSTFILRNLLVRGLIEKIDNPKDQRSFLYKPTFELLEFMGVAKIEDLPQFSEAMASLQQFVLRKEEEEKIQKTQDLPLRRESREEEANDLQSTEYDLQTNLEADVAEEDTVGGNFSLQEGDSETGHNEAGDDGSNETTK